MMDQAKLDALPCTLIVTRSGASEVLVSWASRRGSLPSRDVPCQARCAEYLASAIQQRYGLEAYCLWVGQRTVPGDAPAPGHYAVMEVLHPNEPAPAGMSWVSARQAVSRVCGSDSTAIESFLEDLNRQGADHQASPFAKPGWIQELFSWAREQLRPFGLRLTGGFWQLNASPTFSLMRLQTNRSAVWFKATGQPSAQELPVTLSLARLVPEYVPQVLAVHSAWNGWLSPQVRGTLLSEAGDRSAWETAARALAELQIRLLAKAAVLRESRVRDFRTQGLARFIDPFIDGMAELMRAQNKQSPAPLTTEELGSLRGQIAESCQRLESLGLSASLGRFDLNPGNIVVCRDRAVFLDWSETYWGHPFLSVAYLIEHFRRHYTDVALEAKLKSAYQEPWKAVCPEEKVSAALAVAPLIAAFAYTIASRSWQDRDQRREPQAGGFLRSMTRRMHREARLLEQGRETCLS